MSCAARADARDTTTRAACHVSTPWRSSEATGIQTSTRVPLLVRHRDSSTFSDIPRTTMVKGPGRVGARKHIHVVNARGEDALTMSHTLLRTEMYRESWQRALRCKASPATTSYKPKETGKYSDVLLIDNYDSFTYNLSQYLAQLGCEHRVIKNDEMSVEEISSLVPRPLGILISPGPGTPDESGISLAVIKVNEFFVYEKLVSIILAHVFQDYYLNGLQEMCDKTPIFGVCMGHQCIGQAFGGNIVRAPTGLMHGKSSQIYHKGVGVLKGLSRHTHASHHLCFTFIIVLKCINFFVSVFVSVPSGLSDPFQAARYHSLVIDNQEIESPSNGLKGVFPHDELEVTAWCEGDVIMAVRHRRFPHIQGVQFHPESIITDGGLKIIENWIRLCNDFRDGVPVNW